MDGFAHILRRGVAEDVHLAGLAIDFHVHDVGGKGRADAARPHRRTAHDRSAAARKLGRQILDAELLVAVAQARQRPVLIGNIVGLDLPQRGRTLLELADGVLRGFVHRQPRCERHPAAAGRVRVADRLGIRDDRMDVLRSHPQHLRGDHGTRGAAAADVGRAGHHVGGAVGVDADRRAGLERGVEPEAGRDPAPAQLVAVALRRRGQIVVALPNRLDGFQITDAFELRARGLRRAFLGAVQPPQCERVQPEAFGNLVQQGFDRQGRVRGPGRAVGARLGLIDHHVVAVDPKVLQVVRRQHRHAAGGHGRAGERSGLERQFKLGCGDAALAVGPDLGPDMRARRRPGRAQHFATRHDHLDRPPGLLRQQQSQRLQINGGLAAEAAADLGRHDLDVAARHLQHGAAQLAHRERPLRAHPHGRLAVGIVLRHGVVRLDVALVNHRCRELPFQYDFGRGKARCQIAARKLDVVGDVRRPLIVLFLARGAQVGMQDDGIGLHGFAHVLHEGQRLVFDCDEFERLLRGVGIGGRDRGDRVPVVIDRVARHDVVRQVARIDEVLADLQQASLDVGKVTAGDDRLDVGRGLRGGGVDGLDARVRMRAAQHFRMQQAGQTDVGPVAGTTGHFVHAVVPDRPGADHLELMLVLRLHDRLQSCRKYGVSGAAPKSWRGNYK